MKDSPRPILNFEPTKSTDIAFFCYTSGTTGNPKGAVHLHRWVPGNDPSVLYWQNGNETDIIAHTGDLKLDLSTGKWFSLRLAMGDFHLCV